jgi:type III pantothenate kinase
LSSREENASVLLVLDVGNTKTAVGVYSEGKWIADWRVTTHLDHLPDEYYVLLKSLLEDAGLSFGKISGAAVASVVPPLTATFEELVVRILGRKPIVVGHGVRTGIQVRIENPREVGADRIANTAAVHKLHGGPAIVLDLGTATTFDVISKDGDYLGGAIAPGLGIAADALVRRTAKLPKVELTLPDSAIGRNTVAAMQSGLVIGYIGLVKELVSRLKGELGGNPKVIATGGMAERIAAWTSVIDFVSPRLTLEGIRIIYELNEQSL